MKNLIPILIGGFLMASCQSATFYSAQNVNNKRFDGWKKENADYLVKANDLVITLQNLYKMGREHTELKETYLVSSEAKSDLEMLLLEFRFYAASNRVKLSSSMSSGNDDFFHDLEGVSKENFEFLWNEAIDKKTAELVLLSDQFINHGHDEKLKKFASSVVDKIEPFQEKLGYAKAQQ